MPAIRVVPTRTARAATSSHTNVMQVCNQICYYPQFSTLCYPHSLFKFSLKQLFFQLLCHLLCHLPTSWLSHRRPSLILSAQSWHDNIFSLNTYGPASYVWTREDGGGGKKTPKGQAKPKRWWKSNECGFIMRKNIGALSAHYFYMVICMLIRCSSADRLVSW